MMVVKEIYLFFLSLSERAYHSTKVLGNYMIVFGGYSHHHNDVEACHDDRLYFFHLGCHVWVR